MAKKYQSDDDLLSSLSTQTMGKLSNKSSDDDLLSSLSSKTMDRFKPKPTAMDTALDSLKSIPSAIGNAAKGLYYGLGQTGQQIEHHPIDFVQNLPKNLAVGAGNVLSSIYNSPILGIKQASDRMGSLMGKIDPSLRFKSPLDSNPDFSSMVGLKPENANPLVQSVPSALMALSMPEFKFGNAALKSLPGLQATANALGKALPQAGLGAVTSSNPLQNASQMGGAQLASDLLPAAVRGIPSALKDVAYPITKPVSSVYNKVKSSLTPDANKILQKLGNGDSLENNALTIGKKIQDLAKTANNKAASDYDRIFPRDNDPYSSISSLNDRSDSNYFNLASNKSDHPLAIFKDPFEEYGRDLTSLHNNLASNPSVLNSHWLQSQLEDEHRNIPETTKDNIHYRQQLDANRDAILNDMHASMGDDAYNKYRKISDDYRKNVVPFKFNKSLGSISFGGKDAPVGVSQILEKPDVKTNIDQIDPYNTLVNSIDRETKDRVILDAIGAPSSNEDLINRFNDLSKSRKYDAFITPAIKKQFSDFERKNNALPFVKKTASMLGSVAALHPAGKIAQTVGALGIPQLLSAGKTLINPSEQNALTSVVPPSTSGNVMASIKNPLVKYLGSQQQNNNQ